MKASSALRNRVRIIGGAWRSRVLQFPPQSELRPTPDRVRETLFNWLGQSMAGRTCLDLFAGSGALGFEALSRGARLVVMVESDRSACASLQTNAAKLDAQHFELMAGDAFRFLAQDTRRFDVIFADPPYSRELLPKLLPLLGTHLTEGGLVYVEDDAALAPLEGWGIWRSGRAGKAHYYLLRQEQHG